MPISLILVMIGLLFLLIALVFAYVYRTRSAKSSSPVSQTTETFESLRSVIQNPASDAEALRYAVMRVVERFVSIDSHTITVYQNLLITLCTHPRTDSKLILQFEKGLRAANPQFTHEIESALAAGLASRG